MSRGRNPGDGSLARVAVRPSIPRCSPSVCRRLANPHFLWHIPGFLTSHSPTKVAPIMQVWPAIDLRGGNCVRLEQGDYQRETVFGDDPVAMAQRWVAAGARHLHLVDLDGARDGKAGNRNAVQSIVSAIDIPCQLGGGVRDEATIRELFELGLSRVVVGTAALKEPDWFRQMCGKYPQQIVLGIDARDGRVATEGWLETSDTDAIELATGFAGEPLAAIVFTDIATDGMLAGPNVEAMQRMQAAVELEVIASGGVTTADDVARLASAGLSGCIIGRSLYAGKLTLEDALAASGAAPQTR